MEIISNLENINKNLEILISNDEYTSIGYIPLLNNIIPSDIITIKKAKKLLDKIVVQNISNDKFSDFSLKALKQINADLIIDKLEETNGIEKIHISFEVQQVNSLNLMRGILAVLPSSVFINQDNFEVFKAINIIANTFKNLFSLHDISSIANIKSFEEMEVLKELQSLEKSNLEISKSSVVSYLNQYEISEYQEFFIDSNLFINLKIISTNSQNTLNISYNFKVKVKK
jgi:hypothetical protein